MLTSWGLCDLFNIFFQWVGGQLLQWWPSPCLIPSLSQRSQIMFNNVYLFFFYLVKALIEHEAKNGIPPHRIILGGFSQVGQFIPALHCNIFVEYLLTTPPFFLLNSFFSGWGLVVVYCLDLSASVSWCRGPQLLATASQDFPIGTDAVLLWNSIVIPHCIFFL